MKSSRSLADDRLVRLLQDLLSEEVLPPLDRWFSRQAKGYGWSPAVQKSLWRSLRVALTPGWTLLPDPKVPASTAWTGFRVVLRRRVVEWATRSQLALTRAGLEDAGIPPWLKASWEERVRRSRWSEADCQRFLGLQEIEAPAYVRFHPGQEGVQCALRMRAAAEVEPSEVEGIDRLTSLKGLEASADWKRGLVEIQDASSQLSLVRLGLRPGQRVWDVCAGRGGKTLLAAGEMRGKGTLIATDISEGKLQTLKQRVKRSGWQNIRTLLWEGTTAPDFGPEVSPGAGFDRVIVDAPCSASGTWRRDPDGRYRLTPAGLVGLRTHQERLLRLGWDSLKPGGRLAYVTCSWLPEENERVVEGFLAEEPGASLVHHELLGLPAFDSNTVFVALLERSR